MAFSPMTGVLRRGTLGRTDARTGRMHVTTDTGPTDTGPERHVCVRGCQGLRPPAAERRARSRPRHSQRGHDGPVTTAVSGAQLQDCERARFCGSKPPSWRYLGTAALGNSPRDRPFTKFFGQYFQSGKKKGRKSR